MSRFWSLVIVLAWFGNMAVWSNIGAAKDPAPKPAEKPAAVATAKDAAAETNKDEWIMGQPIQHANMLIFPITSRTAKDDDRFITLDEGLKAGTVEIMEIGADGQAMPRAAANGNGPANPTPGNPVAGNSTGTQQNRQGRAEPSGDVNHLMVLNRSQKSLYLMPGEIVVGGKQDRAVGQEFVIAPSDKPTKISVFCVEHGRWHGRSASETATLLNSASNNADSSVAISGGALNVTKAGEEASGGKFAGTVGTIGKGGRVAVQADKSQRIVWEKVMESNKAAGNETSSGAFTSNYASPETAKRLEPYLTAFSKPVADQTQVIGVIVAINGKVETMDVYESTPLFRRLWPKLLKSYAFDATNAKDVKEPPKCDVDTARQFLAKVRDAEAKKSEKDGDVEIVTRDTADFVCFSAHERRKDSSPTAKAGDASGAGGLGGGIHSGAFSK